MKMCCIKECDKEAFVKGLCKAHYDRLRTGRDMTKPVRQVIRNASDEDRFMAKVNKVESGCWEWNASRTPLGYGQFRYKGQRELSHRVSWMLFKGEIPTDSNHYQTMGVLHKCDNPCCVNPEHLFLGDQSANMADAGSKQRWGKPRTSGESHGRALMTEDDVRAIRASTISIRKLAAQYNLSAGAVQHIRKRRSWKHVE
jgi:hypothetical protein